MSSIKIIITEDGSHSLLNEALDETYHSRYGAFRESAYVFIDKGLNFFAENKDLNSISILEIGFGTGLNALLSYQWSEEKKTTIKYHSLEVFPVPEEIWKAMNYVNQTDAARFQKLHEVPWQAWNEIDTHFKLYKDNQSLQAVSLLSENFDLIYFDAFAPNKQPEMWQLLMLAKVVTSMKPQGVFVTYCAKGQLKRDLKSLGLRVESLPGPPGKREMVRAIKN